MTHQHTRAFTLIELLVVVTIIVILLALLTPAMDKAIYQAELAVCGSNLHAIGASLQTYAVGNGRRYPYRKIFETHGWRAHILTLGQNSTDDRPVMRKAFGSINNFLQDPLADTVDIDASNPLSYCGAGYALWFGFGFTGQSKMSKLGDRFTWTNPDGKSYRLDLLASDMDIYNTVDQSALGSHPDSDGILNNVVVQDEGGVQSGLGVNPVGQYTSSDWRSGAGQRRGSIDKQLVRDDGSVPRYKDVEVQDESMADIPITADPTVSPDFRHYVPR